MLASLPITVLGAKGWIGSALVADLQRQGKPVIPVDRASLPGWLASKEPAGLLIYSVGLTADFRQRPHETVDAHVSLLSKVIQRRGVEHLLLLSSTRVYARSTDTSETALIPCLSSDSSDLYNISKLLAETLVLQDPRPGFKVARLSNVVGPDQPITTFLGALLAEAREQGKVLIQQPADTSKDYVGLSDVVRLLPQIASKGTHRLYNVGSGQNTSHFELATWLESQGVEVSLTPKVSSGFSFPPLGIDRLREEFDPPGDPFRQTLFVPTDQP